MALHIEFDTDDLTKDEARGLMQLLATVSGVAFQSHEQTVMLELNKEEALKRFAQASRLGSGILSDVDEPISAAPEPISAAPEPSADPTPAAPPPPVAAAPAPPAVDVELDSAGQPWNEELHASSKSKVADGTWRKKRGLATDAAAATLAPPAPAAPAPPPAPAAAPTPPPAPAPDAPVPPIPVPSGNRFVVVMKKLSDAQANGLIKKEDTEGLYAAAGISSPRDCVGGTAEATAKLEALDVALNAYMS
ncbi:MAG: hypothetical protein ACYDD1_02345 [Caulobacteraceae bacterium]